MDTRFKWDMLITSFIPLWITIILSDFWDIAAYILLRCHNIGNLRLDFTAAVQRFLRANILMLVSIVVILVVVLSSTIELTRFLKQKEREENLPLGRLVRVSRANKLSSEFLLAYILPMIAFDFSKGKSVMLFAIYFIVLAYLCIRNNNVYTNIYLELIKYRMYECDIKCKVANGEKMYMSSLVISRGDLTARVDCDIKYWDFDNYIYIDLDGNT